ncbi:MAG: SDR family NAD(P)-dependent oxidoreductase [Deltaproteobacteria bacterium]|nr:SDR family NAD(P)-dependent oxidoreductase [Candidatus Zymogenaceae bacterium]
MKDLKGKVAVVTGAASGIGLSLARACAAEGMRVVMADVEGEALERAAREIAETGSETLAVTVDVSSEAEVRRLAERTTERFGAAHLLFCNAGVGAGSLLWASTAKDWEWTLGVNLWGTVHAVNAFVPAMLARGEEGRVVITSSDAGLVGGPFNGVYRVSKHALTAYAETLHHELTVVGAKVGVSLLCPGFTKTRICDAGRNRPERLKNEPGEAANIPTQGFDDFIRAQVDRGVSAEEVASETLKAVREGRFYVITDPGTYEGVRRRMEDILDGRTPAFEIPRE